MNYCPQCAAPLVLRIHARDERPTCPQCGFVHYEDPKLVAVAIIPIDGRLVLGRRSINPRRGYWTFPSGYVNRGEAVDGAVVREVLEETHLEVQVDRLLGLYSEHGNPIVLAAYVVNVTGGALEAGDETSEVGLFLPDQLPDLAFPNDHRMIHDWLEIEPTLRLPLR